MASTMRRIWNADLNSYVYCFETEAERNAYRDHVQPPTGRKWDDWGTALGIIPSTREWGHYFWLR